MPSTAHEAGAELISAQDSVLPAGLVLSLFGHHMPLYSYKLLKIPISFAKDVAVNVYHTRN